MKSRTTVLLFLIALPFVLEGCEQYRSDVRSVERLEAAIEEFYQTVETDDVEGRLALFSEDAIMMPDGGHLISGYDEIAAVLRGGDGYRFRIDDLDRLETHVDDEFAFTANSYVYTWHAIGDEPQWHPTRNIHIWKKQSDGSWRLHLDLWQNGVSRAGTDTGGEVSPVSESGIDTRSYRLGAIGCFAEMVATGVKRVGLSAAMPPEEMDLLLAEAERIAADNNAEIYREEDFLVTDLFDASLTDGMHVLLLYTGDTLQEYLDLKAEKRRLEESGRYQGAERTEIARRMGRLLSYPEETIERLLSESATSP